MNIKQAPLADLIIIEPKIFRDDRGYFFESFHEDRYKELGIPTFVQDNLSLSKKNVLRGLHFQNPKAQGKLVTVLKGSVWDVVVDIRPGSPTFKQWFSINLSADNHIQMYVPPGFAHGFCVLSDEAQFLYKCTDYYAPTCEHGIIWNDKDLKIDWPIENPILSPKDMVYPELKAIQRDQLYG